MLKQSINLNKEKMKIKVKDIRPNPYRNIDHYPLNKEKIMALTSSIEKTGFWDNLVGREKNGELEIAYGHHRIEALRIAKGYGYDFEFDLTVKPLDDATMIKIMANENMDEWGHSIVVIDETVKVTKKFLEAAFPEKHSSIPGSRKDYQNSISSQDIADFLGWNKSKVANSLKRLNAIDAGKVDKIAIESLPNPSHANEFIEAVNKTNLTPKEQIEIAKHITKDKYGKRDVKRIVEAADFYKKYPKGESKKKADKRVVTFEHNLLHISSDISTLSDKFLKLKSLHEEIKGIKSKKGLNNLTIFFASIGSLQRRINMFLEEMAKDTELTEENINTLKQLKR